MEWLVSLGDTTQQEKYLIYITKMKPHTIETFEPDMIKVVN